MKLNNCPHCNVSLIGGRIPDDIKHFYSSSHWGREIGIEYPGIYDGVWEWKCPDCGGIWDSEVKKLSKGAQDE